MDQAKLKKIKPCTVNLTRCVLMEDAEKIRDRILDQRTKNCHVRIRRYDFSKFLCGKFKVRRCCVRLPNLNLQKPGSSIGDGESENGRQSAGI